MSAEEKRMRKKRRDELSQIVQEAIGRRAIRYQELADRLHVSIATIRSWRTGDRVPQRALQVRLIELLMDDAAELQALARQLLAELPKARRYDGARPDGSVGSTGSEEPIDARGAVGPRASTGMGERRIPGEGGSVNHPIGADNDV